MKAFFAFTIAFLFASVKLAAADASAIVYVDGRELSVESIAILPSGDFECVSESGKLRRKFSKEQCLYAWIPKPQAIQSADDDFRAGCYEAALSKYKKAYETYKLLGWDVYCGVREAGTLRKLDRPSEALKRLDEFNEFKLLNLRQERDWQDALKLKSELLIEAGSLNAAIPLLNELSYSKDCELASFAFFGKGVVFDRQNAKREAVSAYLQLVVLFPKSSSRPDAMLRVIATLKELKDPRAAHYVSILKTEYPNSPLIKQLK